MGKLPNIICSSVIRSSRQGESHGGIYIVDLEKEIFKQVVDWNDDSIDWKGRGADRGLRGIAFYEDYVICAASDELFFFNLNFDIVKSFKNKYLKHCHEIHLHDNILYLSSTGFDSILTFNLSSEKFEKGFFFRKQTNKYVDYLARKLRLEEIRKKKAYTFDAFDPLNEYGPHLEDTVHINNVFVHDDNIYFSGTGLEYLIRLNLNMQEAEFVAELGKGTHNISIYRDYYIYNNTPKDSVSVTRIDNGTTCHLEIKQYEIEKLINSDIPNDHARQGFGRGLCFYKDFIIGGSSPSTITVYSLEDKKVVKSINLTMDIRNAIHGLEIYPHELPSD